jgi:chaperonin cofactor prefoldin
MTVQIQESPAQQVLVLLDRLNEQRGLYQQLKALSDQQAGCIQDGSADQLLAVLSQRQSVIEALSRSNEQVAPYRQRWAVLADTAEPAQRQQVRDVLNHIEGLLNEIVEQDERDRVQLKGMRQQIAAQLDQVGKAGRAIKAYGPPKSGPSPATFTDRQG